MVGMGCETMGIPHPASETVPPAEDVGLAFLGGPLDFPEWPVESNLTDFANQGHGYRWVFVGAFMGLGAVGVVGWIYVGLVAQDTLRYIGA